MWKYFATTGVSVLKRAVGDKPDQPPTYNLPPLGWALVILITLIFVPIFIYTSYTLKTVYPVLAIVENPNPAAYEAVAGDDNDAAPAPAPSAEDGDAEAPADAAVVPKPVTASIRRTDKLLRSANGWRGNFRGILLAFLLVVATSVVSVLVGLIPFVPPFVGSLLTQLALVQLSTAWVHTVIRANPSSVSLWRSLPPFRKTFEATSIPVFLSWLASTIAALVSLVVAGALHLPGYRERIPLEAPAFSGDLVWKTVVVFVVAVAIVFLLVIPATVVLVRVQASLLPPEDDTIVPFDRSFNGTVEPAVVGTRSYVTIRDAFRTFSRASWKRLFLLYVKVYLITIVTNVIYAAAVIPIAVIFSSKTKPDY